MSLKPEELLKPRYKVIADYPSNTFNVGQVLVQSDIVEDWLQTDNFLHGFKLSGAKKYPHLFEPLPWYAERKPEDMPEYVRVYLTLSGKFYIGKVGKWAQRNNGDLWVIIESNPNKQFCLGSEDKPATKEEYESYINSKA